MPPVPLETTRSAIVAIRAARALALTRNEPAAARAWLAAQYGINDPSIARVERASVIGTDAITPPDEYSAALADATIRRSALGRIEAVAGFTRVAFADPLMRASDTAVGFWVAENTEVPPVSGIDPFAVTRLPVTKIGALAIFSTEFLQRAPRADAIIARCLENALIRRLDASLFDGMAADASRPASLVTDTIPGTGDAATDIASALSTLPDHYADSLLLVVSPWSVPALIASGAADASTLNARTGGTLCGWPCVTSVAVSEGSVAWLVPGLVLLADAGAIVGASEQAIVRVNTGDGIELHSCWQEDLACLRGVFYVGWKALEPAACGMIANVVPATTTVAPKAKRTTTGRTT